MIRRVRDASSPPRLREMGRTIWFLLALSVAGLSACAHPVDPARPAPGTDPATETISAERNAAWDAFLVGIGLAATIMPRR